MSPFRPVSSLSCGARAASNELLEEVGLAAHRDDLASTLVLRRRRAARDRRSRSPTEPKLLLLDEPICGMGPQETERTVARSGISRSGIDVVLIEHDMEVVFAIADFITVMAQGARARTRHAGRNRRRSQGPGGLSRLAGGRR